MIHMVTIHRDDLAMTIRQLEDMNRRIISICANSLDIRNGDIVTWMIFHDERGRRHNDPKQP